MGLDHVFALSLSFTFLRFLSSYFLFRLVKLPFQSFNSGVTFLNLDTNSMINTHFFSK